MILNTGNRTDIPAYYSEWFYNRIKEGFVLARNPYYPEQVLKYKLSPEVIDCICFCTKNPGPMLDRLDEIKNFGQFWFVTITPYGKDIEPYVPDKEKVLSDFCILSERVGKNAVGWRYDPIFLSEQYSMEFHISAFAKMAERLKGKTNQCVISFIDLYEKTKKNFPGVKAVSRQDAVILTKELVRIAKKNEMKIYTCAEGDYLAEYGADCGGCMRTAVIERAIGCALNIPKSKKSSRETCNCLLGNDIGMYNTCPHGCLYCYANYDMSIVKENLKSHNPLSPLLVGGINPEDNIKDVRQESYIDNQLRLFI
ncbi:MAG: DUF1848 domain-containing protein [Lachnospiraceae bacterium]|nr:DUF1848 domain-containing protein [Lachnospiraceae bacterium]